MREGIRVPAIHCPKRGVENESRGSGVGYGESGSLERKAKKGTVMSREKVRNMP